MNQSRTSGGRLAALAATALTIATTPLERTAAQTCGLPQMDSIPLAIDHYEEVAPDRIVDETFDARSVLKFTVKPDDVQSWDVNNIGPGGQPNERAEVSYAPAPDSQKINSPWNVHGTDGLRVYELSMYFDPTWPSNQLWATMLQFHPGPGVPWGFSGISIHGMSLDVCSPAGCSDYIARIPLTTGRWYDVVLRVNWSAQADGFVEVYEGCALRGSYSGATVTNDSDWFYIKQGYYRDGATATTGIVRQTLLKAYSPMPACTPDFEVSVSPSSVSTPTGSTSTSTVSITPLCGFSGNVSLSASGAPANATAAVSPATLTVSGSTAGQASLMLDARTAVPGSFTVAVNGTSGSISHSAAVAWTIGASGGSVADAQYVRQYGTASDDYGYGVALNSAGDLYFSGYTVGDLFQLGGGGRDPILGKYDSDGVTRIWGDHLANVGDATALALTRNSTDDIYIAGSTATSMWSGYQGGTSDAFVARYAASSTGQEDWSLNVGTASADGAQAVATDVSGNIYVAGWTDGVIEPGASSAGGRDAFVAKIEPVYGTRLWTRQIGSAGTDVAYGVTVASDGSVYVAGSTSGTLPGRASAGGRDLFVAKYDAAGTLLWLRQRGTALDDEALAITADLSGNVYVAGYTKGDLGYTNQGGADAFLAQYLSNGNYGWTRQKGDAGDETAYGAAFDGSGALYITGSSTGSLHGASSGGHDVFVAKYLLGGANSWTKQIGTFADEVGRTVYANTSGIWVIGGTFGSFPGYVNAGGKDVMLAKFAP